MPSSSKDALFYPMSHIPFIVNWYWSQRPLCYTGEGFYCRGMGKGDTNQGLLECIWFFPVLMLSFKTLHRKFSNSHLENALEVILLLLQNKNLRFTYLLLCFLKVSKRKEQVWGFGLVVYKFICVKLEKICHLHFHTGVKWTIVPN